MAGSLVLIKDGELVGLKTRKKWLLDGNIL
jgi:hypothetical protein